MDDRFERFIRRTARGAGRRYAEAKQAYQEGRETPDGDAEQGGDTLRIVCRRHAERRAVDVDESGRPDCFDADHPDCRGCAEDVREGVVERW